MGPVTVTGNQDASVPARPSRGRLRLDVSPLRASRDFRLLIGSGVITMIGSFITLIAVPVQIKEMTGSYVAVGLVGAAEFGPMLVCGLYGGALADAFDRRRIVIVTETGMLVCVGGLVLNAAAPAPHLWIVYLLAGLVAAFDSLQRPSIDGLVPRYVPHPMLPAAAAVSSLRWNVGAILGPTVGGLIVATAGVSSAYLVDVVTFGLSLMLLAQLAAAPAAPGAGRPSIASIVDGLRYAATRRDLLGTYVVDIAAMVLAMPTALFPFLAARTGTPWALGAMYSAAAVGALLATLLSGWTSRVHRHGLGVLLAAAGWGLAIAGAGLTASLPVLIAGLVVAGGADMISGIFRATMWNQSIPDELRGRLSGIELLSYSSGPMLGNARAGLAAQWGGARFALSSGGLLCVGAVGALAAALPAFRRYDERTDPHVLKQRARSRVPTTPPTPATALAPPPSAPPPTRAPPAPAPPAPAPPAPAPVISRIG
ncbi:MAG: MFS transporter [Frankia sp.]